MIDWLKLTANADHYAAQFRAARPFPHLAIDGLCDPAKLADAVAVWPADSDAWRQSQRMKRGMPTLDTIPEPLRGLVAAFNSLPFVAWLERLTGLSGLIPDHDYGGGGLHEVSRGGTLPMHVDFNRLGPLYRRVNLLFYLNADWRPEWHGALELRDNPKRPVETVIIPADFNRLVIFEASERSWHGHPAPLLCPKDRSRRSIAAYYYHAEPHPTYDGAHSTVYAIPGRSLRAARKKAYKTNETEQ